MRRGVLSGPTRPVGYQKMSLSLLNKANVTIAREQNRMGRRSDRGGSADGIAPQIKLGCERELELRTAPSRSPECDCERVVHRSRNGGVPFEKGCASCRSSND